MNRLKLWILLVLTPDAPHVLAKLIRRQATSRGSATLTVLDLGAGSGSLWSDVSRLLEKGVTLDITLADGADVKWAEEQRTWPPNMSTSRVKISIPEDLGAFRDSSFDIVTAFEVIEHLSVDDGYRLLYQMERISGGIFGVSTPSGFQWQPPSANNPLNAHLSGWTATRLRRYGFRKLRGHGPLVLPLVRLEIGGIFRFLPKATWAATGISAWRETTRRPADQPGISHQ